MYLKKNKHVLPSLQTIKHSPLLIYSDVPFLSLPLSSKAAVGSQERGSEGGHFFSQCQGAVDQLSWGHFTDIFSLSLTCYPTPCSTSNISTPVWGEPDQTQNMPSSPQLFAALAQAKKMPEQSPLTSATSVPAWQLWMGRTTTSDKKSSLMRKAWRTPHFLPPPLWTQVMVIRSCPTILLLNRLSAPPWSTLYLTSCNRRRAFPLRYTGLTDLSVSFSSHGTGWCFSTMAYSTTASKKSLEKEILSSMSPVTW